MRNTDGCFDVYKVEVINSDYQLEYERFVVALSATHAIKAVRVKKGFFIKSVTFVSSVDIISI